MKPASSISRGRSRAKLFLDQEQATHGATDQYAIGMLRAIGEFLADRHGDLYAAEVFCRSADELALRVPAHEICAITGRSQIP
jgi:hypothetical protein